MVNIEEIEPRAGLREVKGQAQSYCEVCGATKLWPLRIDSSRAVADWITYHLDLRCVNPATAFNWLLSALRQGFSGPHA